MESNRENRRQEMLPDSYYKAISAKRAAERRAAEDRREDVGARMGDALRRELECIASCELGDVLDASVWSEEQVGRLVRYLGSEMAPYGMLSVEKARECGMSLGTERRQARALLVRLGS